LGDTESAASRAYYAARYAAIHFFLARKVGWKPDWQHETIRDKMIEQARRLPWLREVKMHHLQTFGQSWWELLENRSNADYELDVPTERTARRSLVFAQAVVQAIKENLP
jgi:hypothetical protein